MNTYRTIDITQWHRMNTFHFFQSFDNPCFNITVPINAEPIYHYSKTTGQSFFLLCLYSILRAANAVPQVRQRIQEDAVIEFDHIAVMTPIMTPSEEFCQIWCEYSPTYAEFVASANPLVAAGKQGISNVPRDHGDDYICASALPWIHFSAITQADRSFGQSVPILAWGKLSNGLIPVAGKFHHGLLDGLHIGRFFASIEHNFATPESLTSCLPAK